MSTCRTHRGWHTGVCGVLCVSRVSSGFDRVRSLCERWHKLHSLERALRGQDRNACPCPGMTRKRFSSAPLSPFPSLFPPLSVFLFCQIIVMPLAAGPRRPSTDWRFYRVKRVAAGRRAGGRVRVFIVAGRVSARARATTHAVQSNWKRSPNFLACELRPHSVGRCVYYASHFLQPPLRPNPSPLPSLLCPQLSLCIL